MPNGRTIALSDDFRVTCEKVPSSGKRTHLTPPPSSNSLAYLFRFDWGLDTLQVWGRSAASVTRILCKLLRTFFLGSLDNIG